MTRDEYRAYDRGLRSARRTRVIGDMERYAEAAQMAVFAREHATSWLPAHRRCGDAEGHRHLCTIAEGWYEEMARIRVSTGIAGRLP